MAYSYEKLAPEYQRLWDSMKIIRDAAELNRLANKIKANQSVYQKVQDEIGVPWQMVAVIHMREAGEGDIGQWKGVLHNGEKIVGTGRKTRLVPAGRGPFSTWHAAAIDALKIKKLDQITTWPISQVLYCLEPYNGYGYRQKGLRSPYLWASTNQQQPGKYVADHVFDANVMDTQIGCAALLKFLEFGGPNKAVTTPEGTVVKPISTTPPSNTRAAEAGAAVTIGTGSFLYTWFSDHATEVAIGTVVVAVVTYGILRWYKSWKNRQIQDAQKTPAQQLKEDPTAEPKPIEPVKEISNV